MRWIFIFILLGQMNFTAIGLQKVPNVKIVVIDAGHGGRDPGTVVGVAREKNIVLDIALKLGNTIKQNQKNIKVVYTRDNDYYVPLMDRAQIANKINANLFISIHANYCSNPQINGTETYVLGLHRTEDNLNVAKKENSVILLEDDYSQRYEGFNPNLSESYIMFELIQDTYLEQSLRFASIVQNNFKELAQRHDREVRQAGFLVLRETSMPSVLIETGYLSNKKENSFLLTNAGRAEIAQSIYGSLVNYLNKMDAKENLTVSSIKDIDTDNNQKLKVSRKKIKPKSEFEPNSYDVEKKIAKPVVNEVPKEEKALADNQLDKNKMVYAIQIGVYAKKVSLDSKLFKGITPIKELVIDGKYKYFCFVSESFQSSKLGMKEVAIKFPDAFIVSIQGNQTKMVWKGSTKK